MRTLLAGEELVIMPGIMNAQGAKLAAMAGFKAAATGGSLLSNTLLGMPDSGFLSLTETEFVVSRMTAVSPIPVIVDVDTGYGNAISAIHTTRVIEAAGAAGLIIEDQVAPKRSGYLAGKQLISSGEMMGKIAAAADARVDPKFLIVARTDAHGVEGLDSAIARANEYTRSGADCIFIEGLMSEPELRRVGTEVNCPNKMTNLSYFRSSDTTSSIPDLHLKPQLTSAELRKIGFTIAHTGTQPMRVAALALLRHYQSLLSDGIRAVIAAGDDMRGTPFEDWFKLSGFGEITELETRYLPPDESERRHSTSQPGYYPSQS